jgi:nitrous oxidase accessory protein
MPPMSMTWPWSSRACATSGTETGPKARARALSLEPIVLLVLAVVLFNSALIVEASASTIQADGDIQKAISSAQAGDIIIVGPGDQGTFDVDRPLTIVGQGGPVIRASIQTPAIIVNSDGVTISGFSILGVGKDTNAKFNYYMQNPLAAAGKRLDEPNAAIVVRGNDFRLLNSTVFGAQVGVQAENAYNLTLQNTTLEGCDTGAYLVGCIAPRVEGCRMTNCKKYGLDIEQSRDSMIYNNSISNNTNGGILLKGSDGGIVQDNVFSMNTFGISLWNASYNQLRRNRADHNYYGFLVTSWSNYNNITDNQAVDNSRSEIITGFGIGFSLQENSSYNVMIRNTAMRNFNGLEVSKGCQFNAVYDNNASENKHGIRLNENRNNLIFGNNFYNNDINAYENTSLNVWNTTLGNYYSDYRGKDENGDGIGDKPYSLPGPESKSFDHRPLIRPNREGDLGFSALREEARKYATFGPAAEEIPLTRTVNGVLVISSGLPGTPPKWPESRPLDVTIPPFQKDSDF